MDSYTDLCAYFLGKMTGIRGVQAFAGLADQDAARFVDVSLETWRRWYSDRKAPLYAMRLLAIRGGLMPWPEWSGWLVRDGRLYPPDCTGVGFLPGEIAAYSYKLQLIAALQSEIRDLRRQHELELAEARSVSRVHQGLAVASHCELPRVVGATSRNGAGNGRKGRRQRRTSSRNRSVRHRSIANA